MTLPGNQAAKTSFALDRATLSTDPCESVFSVSTHAESRPTYTTTNCSTSPPNKVGIFSETARSGSRKDNIWASNFVVNYDNAGSAQGLEIDFANRYRDYVIGGTDTNAYAGLGVITQGRFQPDKAIAIDRTGVAALWRRGLYVNAVSDRAIEVNGTPSSVLFVTAGQANMTVNGDFTWGFQQSRGAGASPVGLQIDDLN